MNRSVFVVAQYAFLKHPCGARGYWARTDRCVAFVECPTCKAPAGELCLGAQGPMVGTHCTRREEYQRRKHELDAERKTVTVIQEVES